MATHRRLFVVALLLAAASPLAACATVDRSPGIDAFASGQFGQARAYFEAAIDEGGAEVTLDRNAAGTAALAEGDIVGAHRQFSEAFVDLDDLTSTTGEAVGAMVGAERSKRWKGDPYERCMNAYYLGITNWLRGDVDNAAAAFNAGILRDADSAEGDAQSDFGVLWYLLGQAQREARHSDAGEFALQRAEELRPGNPYAHRDVADRANLLLVLEIGLGPRKVATGRHGAWVKFEPRPGRAAYAEVRIGDKLLGSTARAEDLYHQAITRGDKVLDYVNKGKAVFKDAATVGGIVVLDNSGSGTSTAIGAALLVAGLLTPAEADVRHWATMPGEVHVFCAKLPDGEHVLTIDVKDAYGGSLPSHGSKIPVTIQGGRLTFAWTRALPGVAARSLGPGGARSEQELLPRTVDPTAGARPE